MKIPKNSTEKISHSTAEKECLVLKQGGGGGGLSYYPLGLEFDLETGHWALTWNNNMNSQLVRLPSAFQVSTFNIAQARQIE